VPPGTPITNLDPPYQDEDNPDDITDPFEGDDNDPFPIGEACVQYTVTIVADQIVGDPFIFEVIVFGEIEGVGVINDGATIYLDCRGGQGSLDPIAPECLPEVTRCSVGGATEPTYTAARIASAIPL
jgi:hypothetical protein